MTTQPATPDPWLDADGVHLFDHCRVEQIGVDPEDGALASRLFWCGEVMGRGPDRVNVRFDGSGKLASIAARRLRFIAGVGADGPVSWYQRSGGPGGAHRGRIRDGVVSAVCGARFLAQPWAFGSFSSPAPPEDPALACPACRPTTGS